MQQNDREFQRSCFCRVAVLAGRTALTAALLFLSGVFCAAQQQVTDEQKWTESQNRQVKFLESHQYQNGIAAGLQAVELSKNVFGSDSTQAFLSLVYLGMNYWGAGDQGRGSGLMIDGLRIAIRRLGPSDPDVSRMRTAISRILGKSDAELAALISQTPSTAGGRIQALDPEVAYKALLRVQSPKSPFETTAEYQQRQAMSFDILPGVSVSSPLPFVLNDPSARAPLPAIRLLYDADSAAFSIEIAPLQRQFSRTGLKLFDTLILETKSTVAGHYTGQNAFGATADVTSAYGDAYGIAFDRDNWLTHNGGLMLPMARNQAQQTNSHLRILLLCTVKAPWVLETGQQANPTLDNPTDYTVTERFIFVEPEELQVYDANSGRLLKSFTPESIITEHKQVFPLHLEVETKKYSVNYLYYQIDDGPQRYTSTSAIRKPFLAVDAKSRIIVSGSDKQFLSKLIFRINGQIVRPNWYADRRFYLGQRISDYSAVLQLP